MNILGIETSCDETSASVVRDGRTILSNIVVSSLKEHSRYGGIIPEIASRRQLEYIHLVVEKSLVNAGLRFMDIDAIAVTERPGLIGSLLVGISFANALSFALSKPLLTVNHIHAHIYANCLSYADGRQDAQRGVAPELPAVGLVVSGGHSSLFYIPDFSTFRLIGETRDDAAGEAYDKVARILGLGYPGGPVIDKLAHTVQENNVRFPSAIMAGSNDFSFSGLKTAVLYHMRQHGSDPAYSVPKVAAAFQERVVEALSEKSIAVCHKRKCRTLLVGGGVAANSALRSRLQSLASPEGIKVHCPELSLCMDNAAMVAGLAFYSRNRRSKS